MATELAKRAAFSASGALTHATSACLLATPSTAWRTPYSARAATAEATPNRPVHFTDSACASRVKNRASSPARKIAMAANWPRCTVVQIPLPAYPANTAAWSFASPSAWNKVTTMYRSCPTISSAADTRRDLRSNDRVKSPNDVEVRHHSGCVVLDDVAVVHPHAGPVVGIPRDPDGRLRRHVDHVLQRSEGRLPSVDLEDLEEEPVQMERMIHQRGVDDVPHLQLADLHRLVVMMALAVDDEVEPAAKADFEAQLHGSRLARRPGDERRNLANREAGLQSQWLSRRDADRPEALDALLPGQPVVRQVLDAEHVTFPLERTDGKLHAVRRRKEHLLGRDGSLDESAVGADDLEREAAEGETDVAGARRVDDAPALDLPRSDHELRLGRAV